MGMTTRMTRMVRKNQPPIEMSQAMPTAARVIALESHWALPRLR